MNLAESAIVVGEGEKQLIKSYQDTEFLSIAMKLAFKNDLNNEQKETAPEQSLTNSLRNGNWTKGNERSLIMPDLLWVCLY